MGSVKNVLLHCLENDKDYVKYGVENKGKWINQGWIEALEFVERNFDTEEKTIIINNKQKGNKNGNQ